MKNLLDSHFGVRLLRRREELNLTLNKLATASDVPKEKLQDFESGTARPTVKDLYLLSRALGVSIVYFYRGLQGGEGEDGLCS